MLQTKRDREWSRLEKLREEKEAKWKTRAEEYVAISEPHLHRDSPHHCHICIGTGLNPATSASETGRTPATSAPGLGSPLPHLHRDSR
jgi:hypothetical protein